MTLTDFKSRRQFHLKDKRDMNPAYLDGVMRQLDEESKRLGEDCVVGVWVSRIGWEYRTAGHGLYTLSEARRQKEQTAKEGPISPFFAGYVDKQMLQELKRRISINT